MKEANPIPYPLRLAAKIRPMLPFLPGVSGEYLAYLVDRSMERNGADIDETRALASIAYDAERIQRMDDEVRAIEASGCRSAVERLQKLASGGLLPSLPMPDRAYLHPDDVAVLDDIAERQSNLRGNLGD